MTRLLILGFGDIAIGLCLLFGEPTRTSSPAYAGIKQAAPIRAWGLAILIVGICLLILRARHGNLLVQLVERLERGAALAGALWCGYWAGTLLNTALADGRVSFTGPALWFFFGAIPHLMLSLGREG